MHKRAYITQMSYSVSDEEKMQAERALLHFDHAIKQLQLASNHLDLMKTPFKNNPEMDPKEVMKARAAIRRFRDKSVENFNLFKRSAFQCVKLMQDFSNDTQTVKLMKSFITTVNDLETKVNEFVELFSDLETKDFANNIVSSIEEVQSKCDDIEELVDDRIKDHIRENILATSWVNSVGNELEEKIEHKVPLVLDLYNKRQDALNETLKERGTLGN